MTETDLHAIIRDHSRPLDPVPTAAAEKLVPLHEVKAVLWDIYGTLLISASGDVGTAGAMDWDAAILDAWQEVMDQPLDPAVAQLMSQGIREAMAHEHAARRHEGFVKPEIDIRSCWRQVLDELRLDRHIAVGFDDDALLAFSLQVESRVNPVWPMPGMEETLAGLRARDLPMGIISNAQHTTPELFPALVGHRLEALGFREDLCLFSYRIGASKPDPAMFPPILAILEAEGIKPWNVVYIGNDMLNDVYTAQQAGCRAVLFAGDQRSLRWRQDDERCIDRKPDAVITELPQLLEVIVAEGND
jgi:putative hydrolase of the HAD superfamily